MSITYAKRCRPKRHRASPLTRLLALCALTLAAIGTAVPIAAAQSPHANAFPVTVPSTGGSFKMSAKPTRIVSLSPTATEMLYAVGAGSQVVAVDADSDYPTNAPLTSMSGLTPNVEAIAKYNPSLVIVSYLPASGGLTKSLAALHIPVLYEDAATNLTGTYQQIESIGEVTGHATQAAALVVKMKSEIASAVAAAPKFSSAPTYYFELDQTYYSVTSSTFVGQIMALFHLKNIADAASGAAASGGYPQLSSEFIVKANPKLVFLADTLCCHQSATTVAKRPGWSSMQAVKDGGVVGLNDDVASRWGPRVVNLVDEVEQALVKLHRQAA